MILSYNLIFKRKFNKNSGEYTTLITFLLFFCFQSQGEIKALKILSYKIK